MSTSKPDWCPFDTARSAVENIGVAMEEAERHNARWTFYNDAYLATCQVWQAKVVVFKGIHADALNMISAWMQCWMYG